MACGLACLFQNFTSRAFPAPRRWVVSLFSFRLAAIFAGGHRGVVIPVPIPNTEVKGSIAEGSVGPAHARVGRRRLFSCPAGMKKPVGVLRPQPSSDFCCAKARAARSGHTPAFLFLRHAPAFFMPCEAKLTGGSGVPPLRESQGIRLLFSFMSTKAIVSLGSNIEPRNRRLADALAALSAFPSTRLVKASSVLETEPVDVPPEFAHLKFLNQVAVFETNLSSRQFSDLMHAIEDAQGRVRTVRNGPRTIDIDLISFGDERSDDPTLTLPHPRAKARSFVMQPLAEIGESL